MKQKPGKAGTQKISSKAPGGKGIKPILIPALAGGILLVLVILFLARPRFVWFVDEDFAADWNRILRASAQDANPAPFPRYEVISSAPGESFPRGRYGFIVSRQGPQGERIQGAPVSVYRDLARTRVYEGWHALALDPWMVFRKHHDPEPGRSFLDNANERGSLLLAGADSGAVQAWLCQLLQDGPGIFTSDAELWDTRGPLLARDYPFQSGAFTYSWAQVWPRLFRPETVWLYAPVSQARALPPFRSGLLDASRFPEPPGWDRYGLQADILWAHIQGNDRQRQKIAAAQEWLQNPLTQTLIANTIQWIPAHPSGTPFNTISWETQMAWLRSSYIWQGAGDAQDS